MRIIDPRTQTITMETPIHQGPKTQKALFMGKMPFVTVTGCNKTAKREVASWDLRQFENHLVNLQLDSGAGITFPFYDADLSLLFLTFKGESNIKIFEVHDNAQFFHTCTEYRTSEITKSTSFVPKKDVDVTKNEVMRALVLRETTMQALSIIQPVRDTGFQEDLFVDCYSGESALTTAQWLGGENAQILRQSMNPQNAQETKHEETTLKIKKPYAQLEKELEEANKTIAELQSTIAQLTENNSQNQSDITHLNQKIQELST